MMNIQTLAIFNKIWACIPIISTHVLSHVSSHKLSPPWSLIIWDKSLSQKAFKTSFIKIFDNDGNLIQKKSMFERP